MLIYKIQYFFNCINRNSFDEDDEGNGVKIAEGLTTNSVETSNAVHVFKYMRQKNIIVFRLFLSIVSYRR